MYGRDYRFKHKLPNDDGEVEIKYRMEGFQGSPTPMVIWEIPEREPLDDQTVLDLDEAVSEACHKHWTEHAGDYENPGPQGGETP